MIGPHISLRTVKVGVQTAIILLLFPMSLQKRENRLLEKSFDF
jgi:hypothetical protein